MKFRLLMFFGMIPAGRVLKGEAVENDGTE